VRLGWVKNGKKTGFRPVSRYILETIEERHMVTMEINRKSHMGFKFVPVLMTVNDAKPPPYPM